jgi:hypothetical protein
VQRECHVAKQRTKEWQRGILLSSILGLANRLPTQSVAGEPDGRQIGLTPNPHLDGTTGSGTLIWINAMIPLGGKGTPVEDNAIAPLLPACIRLAGRPCMHGRMWRDGIPASRQALPLSPRTTPDRKVIEHARELYHR